MRKTKFTAALLTFSLLLVASAIAGNSNKGTLNVEETVSVGGNSSRPVSIKWNGPGLDRALKSAFPTVGRQ